jgi:hypothetical protein
MWWRVALIHGILTIVMAVAVVAQRKDTILVPTDSTLFYKDSVIVYADSMMQKRDTTAFYRKLRVYSSRNKFTKFMHGFLFSREYTGIGKKKLYKKLIQKPYSSFDGKVIRKIHIETLDPFGYSISDTAVKPTNFFLKAGNTMHVKSQGVAIRNLLLIRQNQVFDSMLVKESERLVRSRNYIYDVSFFVQSTHKNADSVDVYIRVIDNWSINPRITNSSSRFIFNLTDNNFAGLGHVFRNDLTWFHHPSHVSDNINYHIPSIRNTYVSSTFHYGTNVKGNFSKGIEFDRPFFSPFAKWAAGISFKQQITHLITLDKYLGIEPPRVTFNTQDYWAGKATEVNKGKSVTTRTSNFIYAARLLRIRYIEKPELLTDSFHLFANENSYLASIGVSTRNYVQDKYIFKFGLIEDIPIGRVLNLTGGYQIKDRIERLYLGARISSGYYYTWGYLNLNFEYGTFFRASKKEQGLLSASGNYVTGLFDIGSWKLRQFIKPQITLGFDLLPSDTLTINDGYGLDGFYSSTLSGTGRILLSLQTQAYSPWNVIGFRLGPYLLYTMGMLSSSDTGFRKSKVYSQLGIGVLIKNEHLVFKSFQISLAFYPMIPGDKNNVFKMNSFRTSDYGFNDFEIGKPATVTIE